MEMHIEEISMGLAIEFCGINFPNPFTLASSPATTTGEMIMRGFAAGWGGAVTKTIGPPGEHIANVSPRFAALHAGKKRMYGFENIELISDRTLEIWLEECRIIKDRYPDRVLIASIMAAGDAQADWQELTSRLQDAGCDMIECNLGCPHGMPERGMGAVCSQNPEITANITKWVTDVAKVPVIVKLSPNITDITLPALSARARGAAGVSAINTVNVLLGIDIETFSPLPTVAGKTAYGGYSGPAVRPIALKMISDIARKMPGFPLSASGGIAGWQSAIEFLLVGARNLQVCTAVMLHGFGVLKPMLRGLENYLERHGFTRPEQIVGLALTKIVEHSRLDPSYRPKALIDAINCVRCDMCYVACADAAYQAIEILHERFAPVSERRVPIVHLDRCTGCSLCAHVCPADSIAIKEVKES
ncbi:MAG: NAD-dependent dihydropyrimidine dehydrogenase subunit PreA [Cyanobacteria bacterium NC_groundwater_1444_Ag_S-0.65um_54_12]|nr:NAD-dependent dihydropyrimidine dehydrogenase subunit PreA [Cyanobacteria bacterium NC_groundwater_1444_Ag_S-0.65um_54_12]